MANGHARAYERLVHSIVTDNREGTGHPPNESCGSGAEVDANANRRSPVDLVSLAGQRLHQVTVKVDNNRLPCDGNPFIDEVGQCLRVWREESTQECVPDLLVILTEHQPARSGV